MERTLPRQRFAAALISVPDGVEDMAEKMQHPLQPVRQTAWAPELIRRSIGSANILKSRMSHLKNYAKGLI
jgi:hypothetical protein